MHNAHMFFFHEYTTHMHAMESQSRAHSLTTTDNDNDDNNKHKPISLLWLSGGFIMIESFDKNVITRSCTQGSMQRLCMLAVLYLATTTQRHCLQKARFAFAWR
jgi:hypothetical protein